MGNLSETEWARLAQYFAGTCTPEEADEVRRWIEADPERQRLVDELRGAWEAAAVPGTAWDTPAAWQRLSARLRSRERRTPAALVRGGWPVYGGTSWSRTQRKLAIAAAVVLTVTGGGALAWWARVARWGRPVAAALREVRTRPGQRAQFRLTDGTRVVLASSSVLRYDPTSFGASTRELQLDGRAYFEVTHDPRRPFLVRTARTVTEDLGTEFLITDYTGDPATEVVVASGTVAVRTAATQTAVPATVLAAGEKVRLDTAGQATVRRGVDLGAELAWTEGRLVFVNAPVPEVVAELERWYGIDLQLGGAQLAAHRFTGSYNGQPDSTVVRELAAAIGARVERRGGAVVLVPLIRTPEP
jgi:transmembrane sensor